MAALHRVHNKKQEHRLLNAIPQAPLKLVDGTIAGIVDEDSKGSGEVFRSSPGALHFRHFLYLLSNLEGVDHVPALVILPVHNGHLVWPLRLQYITWFE